MQRIRASRWVKVIPDESTSFTRSSKDIRSARVDLEVLSASVADRCCTGIFTLRRAQNARFGIDNVRIVFPHFRR
jgi:hypothetical protein